MILMKMLFESVVIVSGIVWIGIGLYLMYYKRKLCKHCYRPNYRCNCGDEFGA
jgi:hypothetical protein